MRAASRPKSTAFFSPPPPVSTLEGNAQLVGSIWPTTYYMHSSVGAFIILDTLKTLKLSYPTVSEERKKELLQAREILEND